MRADGCLQCDSAISGSLQQACEASLDDCHVLLRYGSGLTNGRRPGGSQRRRPGCRGRGRRD